MQGLTVVFDLDGTLVETAPDLVHAVNHVMALKGLPPVDGAAIRPFISLGGRAMIEHALKLNGVTPTSGEADRLFGPFLAHYEANIAVASHCFPGLVDALDQLAARGARLAVCTNKQEHPSRLLLDALGIIGRFGAIAGRDTFPVYKPHPEHLRGAVRLAGGDPRRAVMVGDSATDIHTAKAAGVPVVAVPFGYTDVPVTELGPDCVIQHYDELLAAVARLTGK